MIDLLHQITSHPAWPILPIGMVCATWLGLSLRLGMSDAEDAKRTLGRGLSRYAAIPQADLDDAVQSSKHRIIALGFVPAFVVSAAYMVVMVVGKDIHDANVSPAMRFALYAVLAAGGGFLFSSLINWFIRALLARSLDRRFAERLSK
jgi:hypothetical protein